MAGVESGKDERQDDIRRGLRRPKRRVKVRIDMTPMVDIAFLLLIFYMVTTVFARSTIVEIALPAKDAERESRPVAESKLLRLFVDKYDSYYYKIGKEMEYPEKVNIASLESIIDDKNRHVDDLVMLLKLDQESSYSSMIELIDIIQSVERDINAEIDHARNTNPGNKMENYSVRFSLENMNALDEHNLEMANRERRIQP
jgi:biopolymer transport protein ExbD